MKKHTIAPKFYLGHRRLLSLILGLILLLGCMQVFPAAAAAGSPPAVAIEYNGKPAKKLILPKNKKEELTARCTPALDGIEYQWQILADGEEETWVNIYDGTAQTLAVSYAMLEALLDNSGSTYIRCRVSYGGDECVSEPVCVTVEYMPDIGNDEVKGMTAAAQSPKKSIRRVAAQNDDEKMVGITINYLDGVSGLSIYSAYTGHVNVSEEDYTATVISPTYLGYAPKYSAEEPAKELPDTSGTDHSALFPDSAATIELNITKDTGAQYVVNVYYFAIDVPYAVRYYFQNIQDDLYTENVGLYRTSTAKTGTIISNEKLEELIGGKTATVGFTKLYHYPEAVAADGSTVFECYYDRNYRLIKFDTAGGYGVEPIYARYGTPFLVNEPTRHGYVFAGWDELGPGGVGDETADTLPATVPDKNCTYRALWTQANTTYAVAYWLENADDENYSYIGTRKMNALSGITISPTGASDDGIGYAPLLDSTMPICGADDEPGHTHDENGCYALHAKHYVIDTDNEENQKTVVVKGDGSTVLNVYYTRKYYTLRFVYAKQLQSTGAYYVVGGSTYGFGNRAYSSWFTKDYSINNLLDNVSDWGEVEELPLPKSPSTANAEYVTGVYPSDGYDNGERFYYFEITAQYGADLTGLWPADVFGRVKVKNPESHTKNEANKNLEDNGKDLWGKYAYLAGWNGEYKVQYTIENDNSTVKGLYQKLSDKLLLGTYNGTTFDYTSDQNIPRLIEQTKATVGQKEVAVSNATYFLAFFDNGADIGWSVPREWNYELFVPVFSHEVETGSDLYNAIRDAARNTSLADRTYTDPDTNKVYYYLANNK